MDQPTADVGGRHGNESRALLKGSISRRRALGLGAAGIASGIVAWSAPAVVSLDAVAAQTCVPFTVSWDASALAPLNSPLGAAPCFTPFTVDLPAGNAFLRIFVDTTGLGSGSYAAGYNLSGVPLGNDFNYLGVELTQSAPGAGEFVEVVLQFTTGICGTGSPAPIQGLAFGLLDIDLDGPNWTDDVRVFATLAGNPVTLAPPDITFLGPAVQWNSFPTFDQFLAIAGPVASNSTNGNVTFQYSGLVDTVRIRYRGAGGNQLQQIGITDLSGCSCGCSF
jgi:hypothetical protein